MPNRSFWPRRATICASPCTRSVCSLRLSERVRDPEVRGIIDNINASVEALESLFNELLDISKLDAGVIQPNLSSFPIEPLFERMRIDYGPGAADKGIRLSIVRSRAVIYSDPLLVERMLRNLIVNAVHYTAKGGVVVGCRPRGDRYSIEVWDSGVGIVADKARQDIRKRVLSGQQPRARSQEGARARACDRQANRAIARLSDWSYRQGRVAAPFSGSRCPVAGPLAPGPRDIAQPAQPTVCAINASSSSMTNSPCAKA